MTPKTASQYAEELLNELEDWCVSDEFYKKVERDISALKAEEEEIGCSNCGGELSDYCYDCTDKL